MRELLKEASEMLSNIESELPNYHLWETHELVQRIESELAKPDPEPVAWMSKTFPTTFAISKDIAQPAMFFTPLYAEPVDQAMIAELIAQRTMHEEIIKNAYERCRELEQQFAEQSDRKPVTYYCECGMEIMPSPPKPLTDEFIKICYSKSLEDSYYEDVDWGITSTKKLNIIKFARAIENAHGITNV